MNEKYGFGDEVRAKYGRQNEPFFRDLFYSLPLAAIIQVPPYIILPSSLIILTFDYNYNYLNYDFLL